MQGTVLGTSPTCRASLPGTTSPFPESVGPFHSRPQLGRWAVTTPAASSQLLVQLSGGGGRPLQTSHPVMEGRCPFLSFPHLQENWAWLVFLLTPSMYVWDRSHCPIVLSCVSSGTGPAALVQDTSLCPTTQPPPAPLSKVLSPSASHLDPTATTGALESVAHCRPVVTGVHGNRGQEQSHPRGLNQPLPSMLCSPETPSTLLCSPECQAGAASLPWTVGGLVWEPVRAAGPGPSSRPG